MSSLILVGATALVIKYLC